MDLYYKQEVKVGVLVMVATVIFILGLMWLSGKPLGTSDLMTVEVRFADVSSLQTGDPVQVSGFNVGRVAHVSLESVGQVVVELEIPSRLPPHVDARVRIASLDFLGSKYVSYEPGTSTTMLADGQMLVGQTETGFSEGAAGLADQASVVLTGLQDVLTETTGDQLRETMASARRAMDALADVAGGETMEGATGSIRDLRSVLHQIDSTLSNPAIERSINQLDELTTSLQEMVDGLAGATGALSSIMEKIDTGEGSLGLALTDPTLHDDLDALLTAVTALVDDMRERPGRYFRLKVF